MRTDYGFSGQSMCLNLGHSVDSVADAITEQVNTGTYFASVAVGARTEEKRCGTQFTTDEVLDRYRCDCA